jgi:histidine ammonia-lyase
MSYNYLPLDASPLDMGQIHRYLDYGQSISITFDAHHRITSCRDYLDRVVASGDEPIYGINTGFGFLQNVHIDDSQLERLQYNLLVSHACGAGETVPLPIVRLMLMLKVKSLSHGYSGVQIDTVKRLVDMHNAGVFPVVFTQGSLGASGDLAPLSHLSLPLLGLGEVWQEGKRAAASGVWSEMGWSPIRLKSKEGLALINGTQFMLAYGLHCLHRARRMARWADAIAALSFDAFDGVPEPFHESIHLIRPHGGQVATAAVMRDWLKGSAMSDRRKEQVQDPYSFRCIPQVHGATKDTLDHVESVFLCEANAVTDNPNIFPEDGLILSGGNFHGQPLALALDFMAIALSELANISERRTYQLISGARGLPMFLVGNPGLNSGFMIPQYTAAGIVSENKQLCTPASVDSISSSNNQEDHVSMGANAGTKCLRVVENLERVLSIELMTAAQALDFRHPLTSSPSLERLFESYRECVSFMAEDRLLHDDMEASLAFIRGRLPHAPGIL